MTHGELFQAGKLRDAIDAALAEVRKQPTNTDLRGQLCELLCFAGDLERADKQLDTIGQQDPKSQVGVSMLRQLVRAETARQQFFTEGRAPELLSDPSDAIKLHLQASICMREGAFDEAVSKLAEAEEKRVKVSGVCDGQKFDDFRDLDDLCACFLEVLTSNGKYYWIPIERVEQIEFHPPERPKDLLWRRVHMTVTDGPEGEVFIPTVYAATHQHGDEQLQLGRGTAWLEEEGQPVRGLGQRTFLIGDEDKPMMQIHEITFDARESGSTGVAADE
jgi:type VI secretion system protein ImpE